MIELEDDDDSIFDPLSKVGSTFVLDEILLYLIL